MNQWTPASLQKHEGQNTKIAEGELYPESDDGATAGERLVQERLTLLSQESRQGSARQSKEEGGVRQREC